MVKCAFIGLGNMGYPMAGHLVSEGHEVHVFNRTKAKSEKWIHEHNGTAHDTPASAAYGCDFVFTCVGNDEDVQEALNGPTGAIDCLIEGAVIVDHTTASVTLAKELAKTCAERNIGFIDAPISGGQSGAEQGTLSIMCGGQSDHYEKVEPVMEAYGQTMTLIGPSGSGQFTKMVNQILCAGAIQGAAEAIAFGLKAGLDMDNVLNAVKSGAAGSWYLQNRGDTMVADEFDFGFAVDWMHKDLNLVQNQAQQIKANTPLTEMMIASLEQSQLAGDNRMDATVIIRNYLKDTTND
jgi:3-hydroxyisobutyrate dehydrogenase